MYRNKPKMNPVVEKEETFEKIEIIDTDRVVK